MANSIMYIKKYGLVTFFILVQTFIFSNELPGIVSDNIESWAKPYLMVMVNKKILTSTGVKKIKCADGKTFIFCIVYTPNKGDSALARQTMIKICRNKALAEVLRSRGCTVHTMNRLKSGTVEISDGENTSYQNISELLQITQTEARGVVSDWPVVGTWLSSDKSVFYLATGRLFDSNMKPIQDE